MDERDKQIPAQDRDQEEPVRYTPDGYRAGIITAISVLVGFSLAFMRFWGFEAEGEWSWHFAVSTVLMVLSVLMQLYALFRSLQIEDHEVAHYRVTIRWFVWAMFVMVAGVVFAAAEMTSSAKALPLL